MLVELQHFQHSSWELLNSCAFVEHTDCCDDGFRQRDEKRTLMLLVLALMTRPVRSNTDKSSHQ